MVNATQRCPGARDGSGGKASLKAASALRWALAAALLVAGAAVPVASDALAQSKKKAKADAEAPAQRDTSAIQRAYAAGTKAYEAGDMAGAEQQLSVALSGGGLPNSQMARALYLRGSAYRKLGRPAQAISDLTTAVWLKGGLSDVDKKNATEERQLAYREAGLGETPPPIGAAPMDQSPKTPTPTNTAGAQVVEVKQQSFWNNFSMPTMPSLTGSTPEPASAAAAPASATQTADNSPGFWGFLSGGGSSQASAPTSAPAEGTATVGFADATPAIQTSSWETQTAAHSAPSVSSSAVAPAAAPVSMGYAQAAGSPESGINPLSSSAGAAPAPAASSGSSVGSFFGNMFGGSTQTAEAAPQAVTTGSTPQGAHWGADTTVVTAQTSSMVQRGPDSPPPSPSTAEALPWGGAPASGAAPVKVASTGAAGKYKLQVAAVRSRAEAEKLAQTLHGFQPVRDGTVAPEIDEAVIGSMGTFYRVRLGPYADAKEPGDLCKTLKPQGFDCMVVTQ